jgi:SagB-type dehydrogenase family enzyme
MKTRIPSRDADLPSTAGIEVAQDFWRDSFEDVWRLLQHKTDEGDSWREPPKFKIQRGLDRHVLPCALPASIGELGDALAATGPRQPWTLTRLSTFLHHTYGLSRHEIGEVTRWPMHRPIASARCMFPTELYLWTPELDSLPAGCYQYDPAHHALIALRYGDFRELLGRAIGADLSQANCVLSCGTLFAKTAYVYHAYAYRLCSQEAGMVAGGALLTAGALGLTGRVHYQFLDAPLHRLWRLLPDEETLMNVLALYPGGTEPAADEQPAESAALLAELPELHPPRPVGLPLDAAGLPAEKLPPIDAHAQMASTRQFIPALARPTPTEDAGIGTIMAPKATQAAHADLAEALWRRSSGGPVFQPRPYELPVEELLFVLTNAMRPVSSDLAPDGMPLVDCHVVTNAVIGLQPGVHRVLPDGSGLVRSASQATWESLAEHLPTGNMYSTMTAIVYLVGNREAAISSLGCRGYRVLSQCAGLVAHRVMTLASAVGLACRPHNAIREHGVREQLQLDGHRAEPMFQLFLGRDSVRPNLPWRLPLDAGES